MTWNGGGGAFKKGRGKEGGHAQREGEGEGRETVAFMACGVTLSTCLKFQSQDAWLEPYWA